MNKNEYITQHFPQINPGAKPCGNKILVQLRTVKTKTSGGIVLVEDTKDFNNGNTQLARIISIGHIAFRNRETGETWREGAWAEVGDIVIVPRWGGFRFDLDLPDDGKAIFAIFEDFNVNMVVEDNFEQFDKLL